VLPERCLRQHGQRERPVHCLHPWAADLGRTWGSSAIRADMTVCQCQGGVQLHSHTTSWEIKNKPGAPPPSLRAICKEAASHYQGGERMARGDHHCPAGVPWINGLGCPLRAAQRLHRWSHGLCHKLYQLYMSTSVLTTLCFWKLFCCFPNNKPWVTKDIKALLNEI